MASVAILDVTHHPIIPTGTRGRKMPARTPASGARRHRAEPRGGDRGAAERAGAR